MRTTHSVLLFLVSLLSVQDSADGLQTQRENANEFLDAVLRLLKGKYKSPMEPIHMQPRTLGINERLLLANLHLEVRLEDGFITKIGSMKRSGDAWQTVIPAKGEDEDDDTESSVTEGNIDISDVEFNTTLTFDVMGVMHQEHVKGRVGKISIYLILSDNGTTGERDLPYFNIYNMEDVDIQLKGPIEIMDRIKNPALRMAVRFATRTQFKRIVNAIVTRAAQSAIRGMINKNNVNRSLNKGWP